MDTDVTAASARLEEVRNLFQGQAAPAPSPAAASFEVPDEFKGFEHLYHPLVEQCISNHQPLKAGKEKLANGTPTTWATCYASYMSGPMGTWRPLRPGNQVDLLRAYLVLRGDAIINSLLGDGKAEAFFDDVQANSVHAQLLTRHEASQKGSGGADDGHDD